MKKRHTIIGLIILLLIVAVIGVVMGRWSSIRPWFSGDAGSGAVRGAEDSSVKGTVVVTGTGRDLYEVWDSSGQKKLEVVRTNGQIELSPGRYVVKLHDVQRTVEVRAGTREVVGTGTLAVSGTGETSMRCSIPRVRGNWASPRRTTKWSCCLGSTSCR